MHYRVVNTVRNANSKFLYFLFWSHLPVHVGYVCMYVCIYGRMYVHFKINFTYLLCKSLIYDMKWSLSSLQLKLCTKRS